MFLEIKTLDIYRFIEAVTGRELTPTQEHLLLMSIEGTPTGRLKARAEIMFVGDSRQLPPGNYAYKIVDLDFDPIEDRCHKGQWAHDAVYVPPPKKPRKYKDVPFWCKRR